MDKGVSILASKLANLEIRICYFSFDFQSPLKLTWIILSVDQSPYQYTYPAAIYGAIARILNTSVGFKLMEIDSPFLFLKIPIVPGHNDGLISRLLEKLAESIKIMNEKYGLHARTSILPEIKLDFQKAKTHFLFTLTGFELIPPSKILGLSDMIVWHVITYVTGSKPKETEQGASMMDAWKSKKKSFSAFINSLARERGTLEKGAKCAMCGENAIKEQVWWYSDLHGKYKIRTPVCIKHVNRLI